jgi:hypothetical protein
MFIPDSSKFERFADDLSDISTTSPVDYQQLLNNEKSFLLGRELSTLLNLKEEPLNLQEAVEKIQKFIFNHPEKLKNHDYRNAIIESMNTLERLSDASVGMPNDSKTIVDEKLNVKEVIQGMKRFIEKLSKPLAEVDLNFDQIQLTLKSEFEKTVYINKALFKNSFPFLIEILQYDEENQTNEITLEDKNQDALNEVVQFIEKGECRIDEQNIGALLRIADRYGIEKLHQHCEQWIIQNIDEKNFVGLLHATIQYNAENARNKVFEWILHTLSSNPSPRLRENLLFAIESNASDLDTLNFIQIDSDIIDDILDLLPDNNAVKSLHFTDNFKEALIAKIMQKCRNLQTLTADRYNNLNFIKYLKHCPNLQSLNLAASQKLTNAALQKIAEQCPNLRYLNVNYTSLTDASLQKIAEQCPNLRYLNVNYTSLTDASLQKIAHSCSNLQSLNLAACQKFTDASVKEIAHGCPNLQFLDMSYCRLLTDASIKEIAHGCPNLQSLNVKGCELLTDASIKEIAHGCPNLQSLNVKGCELLTDASIKEIVRSYPNLQSLDISGCKLLTDASIKEIAHGCPNLQSLNVKSCELLTDVSIQTIAQNLPALKSLILDYTLPMQPPLTEVIRNGTKIYT